MACTSGPSGEALLVIAALVSFQLAQDRSNDELGVLAAFFTVLSGLVYLRHNWDILREGA